MPRFNELALWAVIGLASLACFADASAGSADEDSALGNNSSTEYFSVPAFFITFRETIEAVVIISILLQFLNKIDREDLKPAVWKGAFAGMFGAIGIGVAFIIAFYATNEQFFQGRTEYIVEAILASATHMLTASFIITVLSASMLKIANMREKWERKLQEGMARAEQQGSDLKHSYMFWLPFTAVFREGIETVIFLAGTSSNYEAKAIPIPGILGVVVGLAFGYFVFRVGKEASLKKLLIASTIILLFIAAGLFSYGVHELQELEMFGTWDGDRNVMNTAVWDICDDAPNNHEFWGLMRALFGYTCKPTPVEIIAYFLYWALALTFLSFKLHLGCFAYRAEVEEAKDAARREKALEEEKASQPPSGKVTKNKVDGNPGSVVDEVAKRPSPMIETISISTPQQHDLLVGSDLSALHARAIALEAATSKTVPKDTALEALHCLARSSEMDLSQGSAPIPLESMDGVWRLCFKDGDFLEGIEVDKHGYLPRGQDVELMFDVQGKRIVLGGSGLDPDLPMAVQAGLLDYTPETQTVTGTFEQEAVGIETLVLQPCLIDDDALGFKTLSKDKQQGFLLFQAEKSKASKARLSRALSAAPPSFPSLSTSEAEKAATAKVAGQKLLDLKLAMELMSGEGAHEDKRLAVQEGGRKTGSFDTFMRYLETEGATIYAVLAGPILFSFMKQYSPVAATKATAAAIVMVETVKHVLTA
eukprot:g7834.t2